MARKIMVTPQELDSAASRIIDLAGQYQSQYDALYSETSAMASTWSGKDNVAFISQIEGFKEDFRNMYQLMLDYADFLRKSATAYRTTQDNLEIAAKKLVN